MFLRFGRLIYDFINTLFEILIPNRTESYTMHEKATNYYYYNITVCNMLHIPVPMYTALTENLSKTKRAVFVATRLLLGRFLPIA